jgi:hypothetical protein
MELGTIMASAAIATAAELPIVMLAVSAMDVVAVFRDVAEVTTNGSLKSERCTLRATA